MKIIIAGGAVLAIAALAACGGGGGGSVPSGGGPVGPATPTPTNSPAPTASPTATASPTVAPKAHAVLTWSDVVGGGTVTTSGFARSPRDAANAQTAIVVGSESKADQVTDPAYLYGQTQATVVAYEANAQGSPLPTVPTFAIANSTVASIAAASPAPSSSPSATINGISSGTTATTATFPDGVSATVTTNVAQSLPLFCPTDLPGTAISGQPGYRYDAPSGKLVAATSRASADLYLTGGQCAGDFNDAAGGEPVFHAPGGYQIVSTTFDKTLAVLAFTPAGTTITVSNRFGDPTMLVATATSGVYVKLTLGAFTCSGTSTTNCGGYVTANELGVPSNASGIFPF